MKSVDVDAWRELRFMYQMPNINVIRALSLVQSSFRPSNGLGSLSRLPVPSSTKATGPLL